jgi:Helix-turn-helix domain
MRTIDTDLYKATQVHGLDALTHHLLIMLVSCKNDRTGLCCPSYDYLAEITSISRMQVYRGIRTLKERGILKVKRGRYNKYSFSFGPAPEYTGDLLEGEVPDPGSNSQILPNAKESLSRTSISNSQLLLESSQKYLGVTSSTDVPIREVTPSYHNVFDVAFSSSLSSLDSRAEQSRTDKTKTLGSAQLDPHSGENGKTKDTHKDKDNNPHHASVEEDNDHFPPDILSDLTNVWNKTSSIDERGPRPFEEKDFIRLVNKWHVKIDETGYHLFDVIIFAWRISHYFPYIKDTFQFEQDFQDVLQKFNGYRSKCSPTKFKRDLAEAWECVNTPDQVKVKSRSETTPDSALVPAADANMFGEVTDDDNEF